MPDGIETQNFAFLLFVGDSSTPLRMTGRMRGFGDVEDSLKKGGKGFTVLEASRSGGCVIRRSLSIRIFQSAIFLNNQLIGL